MIYAVCADLHIANHRKWGGPLNARGLNKRGELCMVALDHAANMSIGADALFILGDVFDTATPTPQMMAAVMNVLIRHEVDVHVITGNHDIASSAPLDHALAPLGFVSGGTSAVNVWSEPRRLGEVVVLPYRKDSAELWIPEAIAGSWKDPRILMMHAGIETDDTPFFLKGAPDSIKATVLAAACKRHGIEAVFAGNWHKPWSRVIDGVLMVQCGTMIPAGFDDEGVNGFLWQYDSSTKALSRHRVSAPMFLAFRAADILENAVHFKKTLEQDPGHTFYRVTCTPDQVAGVRELMGSNHYEIVPDTTQVVKDARKAAQSVRSAESIAEAVHGFVSKMPVAAGVSREEVLARVRQYLA